jgi:transposase
VATVTQAYRFALDPTPTQRRVLASHCGAARVAYNWGLALVKARLVQRQSDLSLQVPLTLPELRREWNRTKDQVAPWWAENSKEAYNSGLDGLARALKKLERLAAWPPQGPTGRLPAVQEEAALSGLLPIHYRRDQGAGRPQACSASPDRSPQVP